MRNASVVQRFSGTMAHPPTSENAFPCCFARTISDSTAALRLAPHRSHRASQDSRQPRSSKPTLPVRWRYRAHPCTAPFPSTDSTCQLSRSEEHTSELQSLRHLVCRLLLEK